MSRENGYSYTCRAPPIPRHLQRPDPQFSWHPHEIPVDNSLALVQFSPFIVCLCTLSLEFASHLTYGVRLPKQGRRIFREQRRVRARSNFSRIQVTIRENRYATIHIPLLISDLFSWDYSLHKDAQGCVASWVGSTEVRFAVRMCEWAANILST